MAKNNFIFINQQYTKKKQASSALPRETLLSRLSGIGPLFTSRLQQHDLETIGDLKDYLSRKDTTREKATRFFQEICRNPRGGQCLDEDSRRLNKNNTAFGNRYRVRDINQPAYTALITAMKKHYSGYQKSTLRKIPPRLIPKRRLKRDSFPNICPPNRKKKVKPRQRPRL